LIDLLRNRSKFENPIVFGRRLRSRRSSELLAKIEQRDVPHEVRTLADARQDRQEQFQPGYAVTSYGSQGRTVDYVLFSDSTDKAARDAQQWYVTISRGRRGIRIFTPDKEQLRENVARCWHRPLASGLRRQYHNPTRDMTLLALAQGRWFSGLVEGFLSFTLSRFSYGFARCNE